MLMGLLEGRPELAVWVAATKNDRAPHDTPPCPAIELPVEDGAPTSVGLRAWVRNEMKTVETEIKFAGYLEQQRKSMDKLKRRRSG